jgi:uncharacterized protein (DUF885 family)
MNANTVEDSDIRNFADDYWQRILELEPVYATKVGDRRFDSELPDLSETGRAARQTLHQSVLGAATKMWNEQMSRDARLMIDVVISVATRGVDFAADRADEFWAVNHLGPLPHSGPGALLPAIIQVQQVGSREEAERYLERLSRLSGYLAQARELARAGLQDRRGVAKVVVGRTQEQFVRFLEQRPETSIALKPLLGQDSDSMLRGLDIVRDALYPAYADFLQFLNDYLKETRDDIGLTDRPGGDVYYEHEIRGWTDTSYGPEKIHQLGLTRLEEINDERLGSAATLGYPTLTGALEGAVDRPSGWYEGPEEVLNAATAQAARANVRVPDWFGRLPVAEVAVALIPPELEDDVLDYYRPASADGARHGTYYVHGQRRPRYLLASTTFHEAIPGHHFQSSIEGEATNRSDLQRFGSSLHGGAYHEGWGLYSERLADEMGLFEDQYERLGMLSLQAMRAARLVVDTGMHALGWSREKAIDLMTQSGLQPAEAVMDVDRYIALPAQALSYRVGMEEITRARERAMARGATIKDFHDAVLELGGVPLSTLARELDQLWNDLLSDESKTIRRVR